MKFILAFAAWRHNEPPICCCEPMTPDPSLFLRRWVIVVQQLSRWTARWYQWRTGSSASCGDNRGAHISCHETGMHFIAESRRGISVIKELFKWAVTFICCHCSNPALLSCSHKIYFSVAAYILAVLPDCFVWIKLARWVCVENHEWRRRYPPHPPQLSLHPPAQLYVMGVLFCLMSMQEPPTPLKKDHVFPLTELPWAHVWSTLCNHSVGGSGATLWATVWLILYFDCVDLSHLDLSQLFLNRINKRSHLCCFIQSAVNPFMCPTLQKNELIAAFVWLDVIDYYAGLTPFRFLC